jgi:hypothetical protein
MDRAELIHEVANPAVVIADFGCEKLGGDTSTMRKNHVARRFGMGGEFDDLIVGEKNLEHDYLQK